jgi:AraC family transcriptional regulator, transcriptional activator of pobA
MVRSLLVVPFREVRHSQPDDGLHYERLEFRGREQDWSSPAHCHEALYQFTSLERGAVVATIDGTSCALDAPAAWMVPPRVMHGFAYAPDSSGDRVSVPSAMLETALMRSPNLARRLSHAVVIDGRAAGRELDELRDLIRNIAGEFGATHHGRAEALQAHAALLALWFARRDTVCAPQALRRPMQDALVERYRTLIEANFRAHWPVHAYAAALNVTADHLSRRCRAVTGLSALELAQERLLLEARRMLAYTDAKVGEVARRLGFEDAGYFSRVFAKHVRQSPLAYRAAVADGRSAAPQR